MRKSESEFLEVIGRVKGVVGTNRQKTTGKLWNLKQHLTHMPMNHLPPGIRAFVAELAEGMLNLENPKRGAQAEFDSLMFHAHQFVPKDVPDTFAQVLLEEVMVRDEYPSEDSITSIISSVKMDSSPGFPLTQMLPEVGRPTNADFFNRWGPEELCHAALARLSLIVHFSTEEIEAMSAVDRINHGLCDPVKVFIKQELHSKSKAQDKRWRIIASVSLIDQLVQRILYTRQNETEIAQFGLGVKCPSLPGMGGDDESLRRLASLISGMEWPTGDDISYFDFSQQEWHLDFDAHRRTFLKYGQFSKQSEYVKAGKLYGKMVYMLSDGSLYAQTRTCWMKSGEYKTSSGNSATRVLAEKLVKLQLLREAGETDVVSDERFPFLGEDYALGDDHFGDLGPVLRLLAKDSAELAYLSDPSGPEARRWLASVAAKYKKCHADVNGWKVKVFESFKTDSLEFCGNSYRKEGGEIVATPTHAPKIIANYFNTWPNASEREQRMSDVMRELRNHDLAREFFIALEVAVAASCGQSGPAGGSRDN